MVSVRSDDDENDTTANETIARTPSTIDAVLGYVQNLDAQIPPCRDVDDQSKTQLGMLPL